MATADPPAAAPSRDTYAGSVAATQAAKAAAGTPDAPAPATPPADRVPLSLPESFMIGGLAGMAAVTVSKWIAIS